MKVRYGFVTNSSSSSFVIAFKNKEAIAKDVEQIFARTPCDFTLPTMTSEEIEHAAKNNLLRDIERDKVSLKELCEHLRNEFAAIARRKYYYDTRKFLEGGRDYLKSSEYKKLEKAYVEEQMAEAMKLLEGKEYFVYTSFSDNDGCIGSYMEHYVMPNAENTVCYFNHH